MNEKYDEVSLYIIEFSSLKLACAISRVFYIAIVKVTQSAKTKQNKINTISTKLI